MGYEKNGNMNGIYPLVISYIAGKSPFIGKSSGNGPWLP